MLHVGQELVRADPEVGVAGSPKIPWSPNSLPLPDNYCNPKKKLPPTPVLLHPELDLKSPDRLGRTQLPCRRFDLQPGRTRGVVGVCAWPGDRPGRGPRGRPPSGPRRGQLRLLDNLSWAHHAAAALSLLRVSLVLARRRPGRVGAWLRAGLGRRAELHPAHPAPRPAAAAPRSEGPGRDASGRAAALGAFPSGAHRVLVRPQGLGWGAGTNNLIERSAH